VNDYVHLFTILASVVGATWVLRSKMSDIESKLGTIGTAAAVADQRLDDHANRIVSLEEWRNSHGKTPR